MGKRKICLGILSVLMCGIILMGSFLGPQSQIRSAEAVVGVDDVTVLAGGYMIEDLVTALIAAGMVIKGSGGYKAAAQAFWDTASVGCKTAFVTSENLYAHTKVDVGNYWSEVQLWVKSYNLVQNSGLAFNYPNNSTVQTYTDAQTSCNGSYCSSQLDHLLPVWMYPASSNTYAFCVYPGSTGITGGYFRVDICNGKTPLEPMGSTIYVKLTGSGTPYPYQYSLDQLTWNQFAYNAAGYNQNYCNIELCNTPTINTHYSAPGVYEGTITQIGVTGSTLTAALACTDVGTMNNPNWALPGESVAVPSWAGDTTGAGAVGHVPADLTITPDAAPAGTATETGTVTGWLANIWAEMVSVATGIATAVGLMQPTTTAINLDPLKGAYDAFTTRFPFSLPWDLARSFTGIFTSDSWSAIIPISFPVNGVSYGFNLDLNFLAPLVIALKLIERMTFDAGLILAVRRLLGGAV